MNTKTICLLAALVAPVLAQAQWQKEVVGAQEDLYSVWAASKKEAYAVGAQGKILVTRDGGKSWGYQESGTKEALYGVFGFSASKLYAVGAAGTLLRGDGSGWSEKALGSFALRGIWGSAPDDLYLVGDKGTILHSGDQGETWQPQASGVSVTLHALWGASASEIFAVGEEGTILRTQDQGKTWQRLESGTKETLRGVFGFANATSVFVVGYQRTLLQSQDHGQSWTPRVEKSPEWLAGVWGVEAKQTVYAVGARGTLLVSTNNGLSFSLQKLDSTAPLYAVSGVSERRVYLAGREGTILTPVLPKPTLFITMKPDDLSAQGASIFVDDKPFGAVPGAGQVDPTRHRVEIKKPGFEPYSGWIEPEPGETFTLEASLTPRKTTTLHITGTPGASVYLGETLVGVLPEGGGSLSIPEVFYGEPYQLTAQKEGFVERSMPLEIQENDPKVSLTLLPAPEKVKRSTVPRYLYISAGGLAAASLTFGGLALSQSQKSIDATSVTLVGEEDSREPTAAAGNEAVDRAQLAKTFAYLSDSAGVLAVTSGVAGYLLSRRLKLEKVSVGGLPKGASVGVTF